MGLKIKTSLGNFEIRPYRPGDEEAILASWKAAFGKEMSRKEWQWKYPSNPEGFRCLLCIAEDGTVAVHYAAQVHRVFWKEREILALHLTDSFSHPRFRGALGLKKGLFVRTGQIFLKTFLEKIDLPAKPLPIKAPLAQFHYGFPGERHFKLGLRLLNYRAHRPGVLYFQGAPLKHKPRLSWRYKIEEALLEKDALGEELSCFFTEFRHKVSTFALIRDQRFLKWRFTRPNRKYKIFYLKTFWHKKIKAWIIIIEERKRLRILDFLAFEPKELALLLSFVLSKIKKPAEVWLSGNHPLKEAFKGPVFSRAQEPLGIIPNTGCDFANGFWRFEDGDKFFFTMADADLF